MSPIIGVCVCVNNDNVEDTHPIRFPASNHSHIPMEVGTSSPYVSPCVTRLQSTLPPVVGDSPGASTPYILGSLVTAAPTPFLEDYYGDLKSLSFYNGIRAPPT